MIRILETKDYDLLANLNEEIQTFHHNMQPNIFKPYDKEPIKDFFKNTLNAENVAAFIAQKNESIVGYVLLFIIEVADNPFQYTRTFVLLDQILVLKKHQGKGVGKLLLETALSYAKEKNIDRIELNHWSLNASARKFFTQNKFEYFNEKMWRVVR